MKIVIKPANKINKMKKAPLPEGVTLEDLTYIRIDNEEACIGAKFREISKDELTACIIKSIAEALYEDTNKVIVDGQEYELTQEKTLN